MRVLHVCSGNLFGGVETIQVTLARHRDLCPEMDPEYTVCFDGRLSGELEAVGAQVHRMGTVRVRNPLSVWKARARLRELLATARFDVAICHSAWTQAIFGPMVRAGGLPLLFWLHSAPSGKHWLERWAQKTRPDFVICCSEFVAGLLPRLYPGVPKQVVYAPVPRPETASERLVTRAELNTPADAVVIIQVSRMEALKGHRIHLEALAALRDVPNWICWIVGGAQRRREMSCVRELQELTARMGIAERVRFLGERSDVHRLLEASDVCCQPNIEPEGFGLTFVEALWAGLAVVTTAIGGGLEIVDSSCGVLVPPGDTRGLAASLRALVTDAGMRSRMGNAGPIRARELCAPVGQLARMASVIQRTAERRNAA
jgi:glycosyltransferase involved in cell wall biosynthesis